MSNYTVIDGKAVSEKVKSAIADKVAAIAASGKRAPCLAVVLVGDDPASQVYVRNKKKACERCGITSLEYLLPADTAEEELLKLISELNANKETDGILVQMPLPKHIDASHITAAIDPRKDVDAFHPENVGLISLGTPRFLPCTPAGVMRILEEYGVEITGKRCVVVGRSNIVGKPMFNLLLAANGTVTVAHTKTADLASLTREADILVAACGRAGMITGDMVKEGAVLIDVGISRTENGLKGDLDFGSCAEKASFITPVPGGVGPMTIAMLMENTLKAYLLTNG